MAYCIDCVVIGEYGSTWVVGRFPEDFIQHMYYAGFLLSIDGGGSALADNNAFVYYEFFARFVFKSATIMMIIRIIMAMVFGGGWAFHIT